MSNEHLSSLKQMVQEQLEAVRATKPAPSAKTIKRTALRLAEDREQVSEVWAPRRAGKSDWRAYLTEEEREAVARAEIASTEAKAALAAATAILNPIRMRACQRRLHASRLAALSDDGGSRG